MAEVRAQRLVLASSSPRRQELLSRIGFDFEVAVPEVNEQVRPGEEPLDYVARVAGEKCLAVARRRTDAVVLAADTTVMLGGESLGKPADSGEARAMLESLSGGTHEVATAICMSLPGGALRHGLDVARVTFAELGGDELDWYLRGGEWEGKAGAYAIQGCAAVFVERLEGDPTTVVGLPLRLTRDFLAEPLLSRVG